MSKGRVNRSWTEHRGDASVQARENPHCVGATSAPLQVATPLCPVPVMHDLNGGGKNSEVALQQACRGLF